MLGPRVPQIEFQVKNLSKCLCKSMKSSTNPKRMRLGGLAWLAWLAWLAKLIWWTKTRQVHPQLSDEKVDRFA